MKIVINAGHTKFGKGTGAKKYLNESIETRHIAYAVMSLLADSEHEIIPAVFDRSDNYLKEVVDLANKENADLLISIHLNAGGGTGVEAYTWKGQQLRLAKRICNNISSSLDIKNRGVKDGSNLYVIKNTKCKAILVECCFVDSEEDVEKYKKSELPYEIFKAIIKECD